MKNMVLSLGLLVTTAVTFAADTNQVSLNLNYAAQPKWTYSIDYLSNVVFAGESSSVKKTTIQGLVTSILNPKKDRLEISFNNVKINSDLYKSEEVKKITDQLSANKYSLGLIGGYPAIDSIPDLSKTGLPEWNLYMQFAKLFPEMPNQPASKGFTWERTVLLPIKTDHGKINCEVYRLFKVDNVSPKKDTAYISWKFKYATSQKLDTATIKKRIPVSGSGTGTAVINLKQGFLISATTDFTTPTATIGKSKVNWTEKAIFKYIPSK